MPELLSLAGRPALSPFRLAKLLQGLSQARSDHRVAAIAATYQHFVEITRPLAADERPNDVGANGDPAQIGVL